MAILRRGLEPEAERAALSEIAAAANAEGRQGAAVEGPAAPEAAGEPAMASADEGEAVSDEERLVTPAALRATALGAIAARYDASLDYLEAWLAGEIHPDAVVELLVRWALPAAELDLVRVRHEARLYIDAYPFEGRIVGNVAERAGRWLAQRTAMFVTPADHLPAVRRATETLAEAAESRYPAASASLHAAAAEVSDEDLWYGLNLEIAASEYQKVNRGKRR